MILRIIGDASYNSERGARSRAGVFYHLGLANDDTFINGPILCLSSLIPTIVCSASEAEYATVYIAGKEGLPLRYTLDDMDCLQPATPITCDNTTAVKIIAGTCKLKRSRSIDQRYHWIRERVNDFKDFTVSWEPGTGALQSIADFLTKPYAADRTLAMRKVFVKAEHPAFATAASHRRSARASALH